MATTTRILADSAFGCAGQRCLAASVAITVGDARKPLTEQIVAAARSRKVGYGLDKGIEMGPVISAASKSRNHGALGFGEMQIIETRGWIASPAPGLDFFCAVESLNRSRALKTCW